MEGSAGSGRAGERVVLVCSKVHLRLFKVEWKRNLQLRSGPTGRKMQNKAISRSPRNLSLAGAKSDDRQTKGREVQAETQNSCRWNQIDRTIGRSDAEREDQRTCSESRASIARQTDKQGNESRGEHNNHAKDFCVLVSSTSHCLRKRETCSTHYLYTATCWLCL